MIMIDWRHHIQHTFKKAFWPTYWSTGKYTSTMTYKCLAVNKRHRQNYTCSNLIKYSLKDNILAFSCYFPTVRVSDVTLCIYFIDLYKSTCETTWTPDSGHDTALPLSYMTDQDWLSAHHGNICLWFYITDIVTHWVPISNHSFSHNSTYQQSLL